MKKNRRKNRKKKKNYPGNLKENWTTMMFYFFAVLLMISSIYLIYNRSTRTEIQDFDMSEEAQSEEAQSEGNKEWEKMNYDQKMNYLFSSLQRGSKDSVKLLEKLSKLTQEISTKQQLNSLEHVMIDEFGLNTLLQIMTSHSGDIRKEHLCAAIVTTLLIASDRIGEIISQFPVLPKLIELLREKGSELVYPVTMGIRVIIEYKKSKYKALIFEKEKDIIDLFVGLLKYYHSEEYSQVLKTMSPRMRIIKKKVVREIVTVIRILVTGNDFLNIYLSSPEEVIMTFLTILMGTKEYEHRDYYDMKEEVFWSLFYIFSTMYEDQNQIVEIEEAVAHPIVQDMEMSFFDHLVTQLFEGENINSILMILGKLSNSKRYSVGLSEKLLQAKSFAAKYENSKEESVGKNYFSDLLHILSLLLDDKDYTQLALVVLVNLSAARNGEILDNYVFPPSVLLEDDYNIEDKRNNVEVLEKTIQIFEKVSYHQKEVDEKGEYEYNTISRNNIKGLTLLFLTNMLKKEEHIVFYDSRGYERILCRNIGLDEDPYPVIRAIAGYVEFKKTIVCVDKVMGMMDYVEETIKSDVMDIIISID